MAVYGLENLAQLKITVDQEVNLLQGVTFAEGITLNKVEVVKEGVRTEIPNPKVFSAEIPCTVDIILTLSKPDGSTMEVVGAENLTVNAMEYNAIVPQEANIYENRNEWKKNVV